MPELGPFGSVRGVCSNAHPYRDMTRRETLGMLSAVIAPVPFARRQLCASRRKLTNDS
jgi:hypothetical protein